MKTITKICCTKCKKCKGISKDRVEKLIGKFGTIEDLIKKYVCRSCRKSLNVRSDGMIKPPKQKRNQKKIWNGTLPDSFKNWRRTSVRPTFKIVDEELKNTATCWRPDIWCFNGGSCNGCSYYELKCGVINRNLKMEHTKQLKRKHK